MLASPADLKTLRYPVWASPKLDGIRAVVRNGVVLSRTLKPIPNRFIQSELGKQAYNGLDCELIVGDPTSKSVYRDTVSGVMSEDGEPKYTAFSFDYLPKDTDASMPWRERFLRMQERVQFVKAERLVHTSIGSESALLDFEERSVDYGYEGLMLRDPNAPYKFGRSTTKEGYLLKLKRFTDSEAIVLDVVEEMHNGNVAETNELGRTKRSSAKAGKTGKGTMGALHVMDIHTGVEFHIGAGFTAEDRTRFFVKPPKLVKYKSFPIGVLDKPRHPVYLGERTATDIELSKAVKQRLAK